MLRLCRIAGVVFAMVASISCDGGDSTTPSGTTTTTTTTTTTIVQTLSESFSGTLGVGATVFFPYTVNQSGTTTATLASIGGAGVPSTVQVRLGIGTLALDGTACTPTAVAIVKAGSPQVMATQTSGTYCVNVTDVGNLFTTATFSITLDHP